jgi:hypothetical protein
MRTMACVFTLSFLIINMWFSGKRTSKGRQGQVRSKVEDYRFTLVRLRETLLAHAAVNTEVAVLESGA